MFWLGDLNFRIDKGRRTVEDIVKAIVEQDHPNFEDLLHTDELLNCLLQGKNCRKLSHCESWIKSAKIYYKFYLVPWILVLMKINAFKL